MPELPMVENHAPWQYVFIPFAKVFCYLLFLILGPIVPKGKYRQPKKGPLLILSNHLADVDPIVVQVGSPRLIHFMAKSELFEMKLLGRVIRWFSAFPVKRGEPDRAAMRHAVELLKLGECVCVFPEGQLSEDGRLQELKPGIALIIRQSGATVICCGLSNTNRIMPYGKVTPRISWHKTPVVWGEPRQFTKESTTEEILEWAHGELSGLVNDEHRSLEASNSSI